MAYYIYYKMYYASILMYYIRHYYTFGPDVPIKRAQMKDSFLHDK